MDWIEDFEDGKGITAAAYVRVSTSRQAKEGLSLEDQEIKLRALAKELGMARLYWFKDAGKSGKDFDTRKLNEIRDLAERHEIQMLLAIDIDRLGRDSRKLSEFLGDLRDCGVIIQTPEGEIDVDKLEGLLISSIKGWAAQHDNERRAKAALSGRIRSFTKKRWNKPVPFGYQKRGDDWIEKALNLDSVVKDVFDTFLALKSYTAVKDAIYKRHGLELTHHQIKRILQNPVYIGKPQYSGQAVIREFKSAVVVEDPSLSYIGEESFRKAQELVQQICQKNSHKKIDALKELMEQHGIEVLDHIPGIAVLCPSCGQPMIKNGTLTVKGLTTHNFLCKKCRK